MKLKSFIVWDYSNVMSISYTLFLYIPFISMLIFRLPTFIVHYKVVTTNNSPCNRIRHVKLRELCLVCTYETSWKRNMQKRENLDIDPRREKLTLKTGWYSDRWKYSIKIIHPLTMILPLHAIYLCSCYMNNMYCRYNNMSNSSHFDRWIH